MENSISTDYKWRVSRAALFGDYTEDVLRVQMAGAMPVAMRRIQSQLLDLIDYHVRECIRQETRMRRCKNCGRYFAIQIRSTAEYCDRVIVERGRTCKDVGAITTWTRSKKGDTLFNDYRREYKKRFARTKVGKYTADALCAWGERARAKPEACRAGTISVDEFREWPENS